MSQAQTTELTTPSARNGPYWMSHPDPHTPVHRLIGYDGDQPLVCDPEHPYRPTSIGTAVSRERALQLEAFWCRKCLLHKTVTA